MLTFDRQVCFEVAHGSRGLGYVDRADCLVRIAVRAPHSDGEKSRREASTINAPLARCANASASTHLKKPWKPQPVENPMNRNAGSRSSGIDITARAPTCDPLPSVSTDRLPCDAVG